MTFQDAAAEAAAAPVPPVPAARFVGVTKAFWRLQLRGAMLLAVTLGIYRFWLATDVRRFLWSNTEIAGESLEYNGTPTELLVGFLMAIAILVPLNLGLFVVALSLGPAGEFVSMLGFPLLFVLGQFAIYRARRYRLTRTVLRGVRCHQTGSGVRYAFTATLWWILVALTLGLAYPFMQASLERYKMRNTWYGDLAGRFEGSGWMLFARGVLMWFAVMAPLAFGIVAALGGMDWSELDQIMAGAVSEPSHFDSLIGAGVIAGTGVSVSIALALLLFPVFQAMTLRWWLDGIRFGALTVRSNLLKRRIYGAYARFFGYAILFSLVAGLVLGLGLLALGALSIGGIGTEIIQTLAAVAFYVVTMLGFSAIYQTVVRLALWRHAVASLEIEGLAVLDGVKATGRPSSPVGEGLADALNVGGI